MKYYFFKTVKDGSRNRFNPLPHQTTVDGSPIMQKLNTQVVAGGMKIREAYPLGTIFCSAMCELSARGGTSYYCAGDIYPIIENGSYEYSLPVPTREMLDAYDNYKKEAKDRAAMEAMDLFSGCAEDEEDAKESKAAKPVKVRQCHIVRLRPIK